MSKQKILWRTNNFRWIQILLCIQPLFVSNAGVTQLHVIYYDDTNIKIFENVPKNFEFQIFESLQITRNFFAQPEVKQAILLGLGAGILYPPLAPITGAIFVCSSLLAKESDWRAKFSNAIAHETNRAITSNDLEKMNTKLKTINRMYRFARNETVPIRGRRRVASQIHFNLQEMLNYFASSNSLFKKYPLLVTPLLIELAQIVAYFDLLAKKLIPRLAKDTELSCLMRNILLDYRPRAAHARLEKVHSDDGSSLVLEDLSKAMSRLYKSNGYSRTLPRSFACKRGCIDEHCLRDDFGDNYDISNFPNCTIDYALFVRHRVEDLYSTEALDLQCLKPPRTTGTYNNLNKIYTSLPEKIMELYSRDDASSV